MGFPTCVKAVVWGLTLVVWSFGGLGSDTSIELIAPLGGETFHSGDTFTTQWILHNDAEPNGGVVVSISADGGRSWTIIVTETLHVGDTSVYEDSVGTFKWTIEDSVNLYTDVFVSLVSEQCQIAVGAPYDGVFARAISDDFTILPSASSVRASFRLNESQNDPARHNAQNRMSALSGSRYEMLTINGRLLARHDKSGFGDHSTFLRGASGLRVFRLRSSAEESIHVRHQY